MADTILEQLLDKIADALIQSDLINTQRVEDNQKFIRNGLIEIGREDNSSRLVLSQKDIEANPEDFSREVSQLDPSTGEINVFSELEAIANTIANYTPDPLSDSTLSGIDLVEVNVQIGETGIEGLPSIDISLEGDMFPTGGKPISNLIIGNGNPINLSQFVPLTREGMKKSVVDVEQAEEFLDTNIYELLPTGDTRQDRIIRFFQELNALLPPREPNFKNPIERDVFGDWKKSEQYSQDNSISYAQDNPSQSSIDEEDAYIHRLKRQSINNEDSFSIPNDINDSRTIEDIYNTIKPYLNDILEIPASPEDERPTYRNQSSGYLKFRNLNQGIIIRNTNTEFLEGLNPNNPTWLDTGFTITMWVRFLDKSSQGTLFNYGNPTRGYLGQAFNSDAFGFKLETYNLNKDDLCPHPDYETWGSAADNIPYANNFFESNQSARFVRLVVNDFRTDASGNPTPTKALRDSHIGALRSGKLNSVIPLLGENDNLGNIQMGSDSNPASEPRNALRLLNTTFIPMDFTEWYFICASYNPNIFEDQSKDFPKPAGDDTYEETPDFWMNNINPSDNLYVNNSGYGNRCKVEIISRSDLLRARGFKVE